eukprot:COSAG04_NODE_5927_length_1454_cov_0.923247_3_plen_125_part_01
MQPQGAPRRWPQARQQDAGEYELKEGFPPKKLRPCEETLDEAGLAIQSKLVLQVFHLASQPSAEGIGPAPSPAPPKIAAPADELAPGGAIYEAVRRKYVGTRPGAKLEAGRTYRAPLVRGRCDVS